MATVSELYLRIKERKYRKINIDNYLSYISKINDNDLKIPKILKNKAIIDNFNNMQILKINNNSKYAIIYLHGSSYVRNPRKQHYYFINKLSDCLKYDIVFPKYPKAPNHSYLESYRLLTDLYINLLNKYEDIIIIGDSAGGGLALGLAISLKKNKIKSPSRLILLSPWVDVSLSNPQIKNYEDVDPLVSVNNAKKCALKWANGTDLKSYMISPIYGDMVGLSDVALFVGTREVLYPDTLILYDILKDSKVNTKLFIGKGLNHVYPIYPIPEAKKVLKQIKQIIENRGL